MNINIVDFSNSQRAIDDTSKTSLEVPKLLSRFLEFLVCDDMSTSSLRDLEFKVKNKDFIIAQFMATDNLAQTIDAQLHGDAKLAQKDVSIRNRSYVPRQCQNPICLKRPSFAAPGEKARFCSAHRREGDVDVAHRTRCGQEGCNKHPAYGFEGIKVRYCSAHKQEGMVDLKRRKGTVCPFKSPQIIPLLPSNTPLMDSMSLSQLVPTLSGQIYGISKFSKSESL